MLSLIKGIIEKKEDAMRRGVSESDDILGLLLKGGLSTTEIIEECKEFYLAGQDTTTALLSWTLVALSMHPEWQDKARNEVFQVLGKNKPKFEDLNQLKIVSSASKLHLLFDTVNMSLIFLLLINYLLDEHDLPRGVEIISSTHPYAKHLKGH